MYFCIPKLNDLKLFRKKDFVALVFISLFSMSTIALFYQILKPEKVLPIYQPNLVNEKLVDSTVSYISKYHTIADFSLINQNGEEITEKELYSLWWLITAFYTDDNPYGTWWIARGLRMNKHEFDNNCVNLSLKLYCPLHGQRL